MTLSAIKPAKFDWFPYEGFTFCLGLAEDSHVWTSGHTSAAFDPGIGKMTVSGPMESQAATAYEKVLCIIEGAGLTASDVVHVTEYVTVSGLPDYEAAKVVRERVFADHQPTVTTVVVERLVRAAALLEVELSAVVGGGSVAKASSEQRPAGVWVNAPIREGFDGTVHLPTIVPIDDSGEIVHPGDFVGQYAYCLEQAGQLLSAAGLTLDQAVTTFDYSTPATRPSYHKAHRVRRDLLGGSGIYPCAAGILMSRLHHPDQLVALDVTASRHPLELVNPGWSRYETLFCSPGVKAGRTLFMSGFGSLDMETQQVLHPHELGPQAEVTFGAIQHLLNYAGLGPADLLSTIEFCVVDALPNYRVVADVRERMLLPPWPASTGAMCKGLLRDELMLEVVPTALYPKEG
jgi:enamine deaminase RidA (YjgF/YER057c/UK114 family)